MQDDTIFALSSGAPPSAIAVVRISGPCAGVALQKLAGALPEPRRTSLRTLRDQTGELIDQALILYFPGPATATGEDVAELHLHGGRAVVEATLAALEAVPGLRPAVAGEFTRRALDNGRMDLMAAEGLADLLTAETQSQRRQALLMGGRGVASQISQWGERLMVLSAAVEAALDFADEGDVDVGSLSADWRLQAGQLEQELVHWLARPPAERLRDGVEVVIAGPPNSGKSTLINAIAQNDIAIVSDLAGTTRDVVEVSVALSGVAFRIADTAGLRADSEDAVELEGMARARARMRRADLLLWLGDPEQVPDVAGLIRVAAQADRRAADPDWTAVVAAVDIVLSAKTGSGMADLADLLVSRARQLLPREGEVALNRRQRDCLQQVQQAVGKARSFADSDPLLAAEELRLARSSLDSLTGQAGTEAMLDALFGRFCIGK